METALDIRQAPWLSAPPRQVETDQKVIEMWLKRYHSPHTRKGYERDFEEFCRVAGYPALATITVETLQDYADSLSTSEPATFNRKLAAVKSLLSYACKIGYLRFNPGVQVQAMKPKDTLAERILTESEALRMIMLEQDPRNHLILRLLYAAGMRVSELCGLAWKDVTEGDKDRLQLTVYGKGSKTRFVLLSEDTSKELRKWRFTATANAPVFKSRKGNHMSACQVWRIVATAAARAGIEGNVSPHWLRHSHASHALDRGCPISLLQATLGHANVATTGRYLHAKPDDSSSRFLMV